VKSYIQNDPKLTNDSIETHIESPPSEYKNNTLIQHNNILHRISSKSNKMQVQMHENHYSLLVKIKVMKLVKKYAL